MPKAKIIAIANQKGGVGKTTTAINIATTLVALGRKVLLIDLDGQGNASTGLGIHTSERKLSSYDVLAGGKSLNDVIVDIENVEGLSLAPASSDLSSVDVDLINDRQRVLKLKQAIENIKKNYDYVFIDCPPSLNLLTVNAFAAAHSVLVPLQCEFFALEGLSQLMGTIKEVREALNPSLEIQGIVLTMYDKRNNLTTQVEDDVRENLGDLVYDTVIPRNVRLSEAPSFGMPALLYDPKSLGSVAYQRVAIEFMKRENDKI